MGWWSTHCLHWGDGSGRAHKTIAFYSAPPRRSAQTRNQPMLGMITGTGRLSWRWPTQPVELLLRWPLTFLQVLIRRELSRPLEGRKDLTREGHLQLPYRSLYRPVPATLKLPKLQMSSNQGTACRGGSFDFQGLTCVWRLDLGASLQQPSCL
jgi:hypothetical protein